MHHLRKDGDSSLDVITDARRQLEKRVSKIALQNKTSSQKPYVDKYVFID